MYWTCKSLVFTAAASPRSKNCSIAPFFGRLRRSQHTSFVFARFGTSVIEIEVLNEKDCSLLSILYFESLQKQTFFAFCNDFSHVRRHSSQNNISPSMTSRANSPHSSQPRSQGFSLEGEMKSLGTRLHSWARKSLTLPTLKIHRKLMKIATTIIFFFTLIKTTRRFI